MGHCASRDQKDQKNLNRRIDEQIKKDQSMSLRIIKLLLLGTSWRKWKKHNTQANEVCKALNN
ncbi:unnamed protein product [Brugia timori]|uniref:Uncharacterized protein n=1 Tax=Brugia timori TaxID=42155 RepID=A0A0R3QD81_9BILA|nr:unnamed protein product [Brugia timori]